MTSSALINLLLAICLLAANAFYVAAEFALVKSRGFRINAMAEEGRFRGLSRILPAWHHHGIARAWLGWRTDRFSVAGASFASGWNARIGAALNLLRDGLPGFFLVAYRGW